MFREYTTDQLTSLRQLSSSMITRCPTAKPAADVLLLLEHIDRELAARHRQRHDAPVALTGSCSSSRTETAQLRPALHQRQMEQVFAVKPEHVEGNKKRLPAAVQKTSMASTIQTRQLAVRNCAAPRGA